MDTTQALTLLGGLSPQQFMKRHWQKKPLLVRGALPGFKPLLDRNALFAMAERDEVESRFVAQQGADWKFRRGPFARRALPPLSRPGWTLLVQGMDLHHAPAHELLSQFRFVPQARLDDLMISWATDGGGVGPHFDSYDVFLLQAQGQRRWRIGRQKDLSLREGVPLKILDNFEPEEEYVLDPGDMLYLPPRYAHDGIAQGECQTYSIGFRAPGRGELAQELLHRLAEDAAELAGEGVYGDRGQDATDAPGAVPARLQDFARDAVQAALKNPVALDRALGEYLTEPKASVWFESGSARGAMRTAVLDRRTGMMYDAQHVFINGESYLASGRDAQLMRRLADRRRLTAAELAGASEGAVSLLKSWREAGWVHAGEAPP
ncbi:JmjC domain-containing protein [Ramlibacter sp. WS9]|uniref:JmjC domain-containing protein n=1 Tax=Ramlibacter sp. WS9 TaxID=1882741 RepID=UPI0011442BC9|nr:cupin domain-containing protein [Ramlibacter sp. WS9]ROZ62554.1 cupin domain-containing protein [Ramlibacter sp. WS9]